ncbi:MAG: outer membrane lipoprotein chaperone LolA [Pseudohongiellaceae bacterium]|nr:outer membrane lipoprotein chaperone LolA [Pseudohongiellaceae bacterium]
MTIRPLLMLCLALLSSSLQAQVEVSPTQKLTQLLSDIETFKADVRQLIIESSGGVLEESEIRFKLKRPNGFYWETVAPFPELIVTDGERLWNYQPDLLQVTIEPWSFDESELAAKLLSGRIEEVEQDYDIQWGMVNTDESWEFVLDPVDENSVYSRVTLFFGSELLDSIHIDSGNGQRTFWEFENHQINEPIEDEVFSFSPPDDIDIIDNTRRP